MKFSNQRQLDVANKVSALLNEEDLSFREGIAVLIFLIDQVLRLQGEHDKEGAAALRKRIQDLFGGDND